MDFLNLSRQDSVCPHLDGEVASHGVCGLMAQVEPGHTDQDSGNDLH